MSVQQCSMAYIRKVMCTRSMTHQEATHQPPPTSVLPDMEDTSPNCCSF
jgi:hypothetical protein